MTGAVFHVDTSNSNVNVTGNVHVTNHLGIGTTSPNTTLHVKNETDSSGTGDAYISGKTKKPTECLRLQGKYHSTGSGALLRFTNQHDSGTFPNTGEYNLAGIAGYDHDNSWGGGLAFYTSPGSGTGGDDLTSRMVIDSNGNVGVGTNTPGHKLEVNGTFRASTYVSTPYLHRSSHSSGYMVGSYNSVGANDAKSNPIYTIGSSYKPPDNSLGDMYGIGYSHANFTSILSSNEGTGWGMYVAADGDARIGLNGTTGSIKMRSKENGDSYAWEPGNDGWMRLQGNSPGQGNMYSSYTSLAVGNFWSSGYTRFSSDDRVKHFEEEIPALEIINQLNPYKYKKTSKIYTEDYTGEIGEEGVDWVWEIGLIAQDIKKIPYLEFAVSNPEDGPEGKYGLNYTQFIGVCVQGIKEMDQKLQTEKARNNSLEARILALEKRIN